MDEHTGRAMSTEDDAQRPSPENVGPRRLRKLLDAVMTVSTDLELSAVLQRIVESAVDLVDARYGALGVLDEGGGELGEFIAVGLTDEERAAIGPLPHGHGILGLLILDPRPIRLPVLQEHPDSYGFPPNHPPMTSFLGVPIMVRGQVFGNLYLTDKTTAEVFTDIDEELVVSLASAAAVAIENARLHGRISELVVLEDRERIARDLHDSVIQRLFAVGLSLQGTVKLAQRDDVRLRIQSAVDDLDQTVREIRTAIFGLETTKGGEGVRDRVLSLTREAVGTLGFEPRVSFAGPVDAIGAPHADDVVAVAREALANVARHAAATEVSVALTATDDGELVVAVADNGVGQPPSPRPGGHGLHNMATRADKAGGTLSVGPSAAGGTLVELRLPPR